MDKKTFGLFIKESRLKQKLTQKELADILFIDVTAVSKWERGVSYPDITLVPDLCKALSLSEHELIESSTDVEYRKMKMEAKSFRTIKVLNFLVPTICYAIAIFVCFIVNLAVNHTLSWFWIVLAGCLVGFTFFPTVLYFFPRKKLLIFIVSTFASLFLLFLTMSIMHKDYWFMVATSSVLLGYFVFFYPFIFYKLRSYVNEDFYKKISKYFSLIYGIGILVITLILLLFVDGYRKFNLGQGILITLYSSSILIVFGVINLIRINRFYKLSACSFLFSFYFAGINPVISTIIEEEYDSLLNVDFTDWKNSTNSNVTLITMLAFFSLAIIFLALGIFKTRKER